MTVYSTFLMLDPRAGHWARKTHVHRGDVVVVHERHDTAFTVERNLGLTVVNGDSAIVWRFLDDQGREWQTPGSYVIYWPFAFCPEHASYRPCEHNGAVRAPNGRAWEWPRLSEYHGERKSQ